MAVLFSSLLSVSCREKWYGLLFSQSSSTKKANLVLCVLYPNSDLPWLGQMAYLGPKAKADGSSTGGSVDPRLQGANSDANPFPVGPSHLPSFHTPSNLLWAKEPVLQVVLESNHAMRFSLAFVLFEALFDEGEADWAAQRIPPAPLLLPHR